MLKRFDDATMTMLEDAAKTMDALTLRDFMSRTLDIGAETVVARPYWARLCKVKARTYLDTDKGLYGKMLEVAYRLANYDPACRWLYFREFYKHPDTMADFVKTGAECKSGTGDWLLSYKYNTFEDILDEFSHKTTTIHWETEDFCIDCSWSELFDYLSAYNDKGIKTWFNSCLKVRHEGGVVVKVQEYSTSKRKLRYLVACPYNDEDKRVW